jgi:hypothetical protein
MYAEHHSWKSLKDKVNRTNLITEETENIWSRKFLKIIQELHVNLPLFKQYSVTVHVHVRPCKAAFLALNNLGILLLLFLWILLSYQD